MNDPSVASSRRGAVLKAKREEIPKDEAWGVIQHEWTNMKYEGHLLKATIDNVYDE